MKESIDQHLRPLVGLPLRYASRAVDMATFGFGKYVMREIRGESVEVAEYRLHIQCQWRIVAAKSLIVGYGDWHWPAEGSDVDYADFVEHEAARNRRDDLTDQFLSHGDAAHIVLLAYGSDIGDIRMELVDGCILETFVNHATRDEGHDEHWRLLPPDFDVDHFVVTASGIET